MNQNDAIILEKLVREAISIGKWDDTRGPSYSIFDFNVRLGFLVDEILSVSDIDSEIRKLKSSRRMEVVERALTSLRQKGKFDADSIVEALRFEVETIRKEPVWKYSVVWPIPVSLYAFFKTPESYLIDGNSIALIDYYEFEKRYLPKTTVEGRIIADTKVLKEAGFTDAVFFPRGPPFLTTEIYARDPWQAALESGNFVDLFLSLADLSSGTVPAGGCPVSPCPNPTLCFVFKDPESAPVRYGQWIFQDLSPFYLSQPDRLSQIANAMNSIRENETWPVIRRSLLAFRRAMYQTNPEEALVQFWTACEISVAVGDGKIRDIQAEKRMERIFRNSWYQFGKQVHTILDLRNKILHEGISEVQPHHIRFSHMLFQYLVKLLLSYSKEGKSLADIRAVFEVAKMTDEQRKSMLEALQEPQ